jgi:hypothetical protein
MSHFDSAQCGITFRFAQCDNAFLLLSCYSFFEITQSFLSKLSPLLPLQNAREALHRYFCSEN